MIRSGYAASRRYRPHAIQRISSLSVFSFSLTITVVALTPPTSKVLIVFDFSLSIQVSKSSLLFALLDLVKHITNGTLFPPVPILSFRVWQICCRSITYLASLGLLSNIMNFNYYHPPLDYTQDCHHSHLMSSPYQLCRYLTMGSLTSWRWTHNLILHSRLRVLLCCSMCTSLPLLGIRHPCEMVGIRCLQDKQCLILAHSECR